MIEQPKSLRFTWQSSSLFVSLTLLGFLIAGFLHIESSGPTAPFNLQDLDLFAGLIGFVFGAVSGLIIGSLQWIVLKSWLPNARLWIPLNAIGLGLVHFTHDALPYQPLPLPLILMVDGIVIGLAQFIAIRHTIARAFLWVPVAAFAWFSGFQMGFAWLDMNGIATNPLAELMTVFGTAGLIIGGITSVALNFMVSDRASQAGRQTNLVKTAGDSL